MPNRETKDRRALWALVTIFVCVTVGIVAAGYVYYRNYEKQYRSEVERQLSAIADLKVDGLVQWRKERLEDGAVFFKNGSFSGLVRRFFEKPADADAKRQLQDWLGRYLVHDSYEQVRLLDAQGVTHLSVPDDLGPVSSVTVQSASDVLRSGQVAIQDFYRNDHDQHIYLAVLVPVPDERDAGRPLGVLVLRIDPEAYLYPFIKRWPTPSRTAETLLVRREGNEVVFLNELRFQKNVALTRRAPVDQKTLPAARAALGQEGVMEGIDYRGVQVVAALRTVPNSPWLLVARMDVAEIFAPLREQLRLVVALISALLLGAGAGIALLWRQQRVRFYRERAENARRMATVVRDSNDAITIQDFEGKITAWNRGAELMYGYSEAEALAANIDRLTTPGKVAEQKDFIRRLIAGEAITSFETQRVTKDGRVLDVWMTVTKLMDEAGKPVGLASTERDITERKQAEETLRENEAALRASEEQYRAIFETASVGIAQSDPRTGQWLHVNGKMCEITGYSADELLRMHLSEVIHPEDRQSNWEAFQRVVQGEQPDYRLEKRYIRKDGSLAWVNVNMTVIRDAAGQPVRTVATIEDITARKQATEALAASEVRYRRLFEAARDGVLILDAETGMIVDVNPFLIELLGVTREVFLGKRVWELGFFKDVVANEANFLELQQKGYVRYENMALEGRDGKRHEVEFISNVYDVDHSRVIQCNIRDISERKRMEEARRQQTEELRTRNAELMRINRASEGRELRMVELKQQINELCRQLGQPPRHPLDFLGARPQTTTAAEVVGPKGASRTEADLSERPDFKANQTNVPRGAPRRAAE